MAQWRSGSCSQQATEGESLSPTPLLCSLRTHRSFTHILPSHKVEFSGYLSITPTVTSCTSPCLRRGNRSYPHAPPRLPTCPSHRPSPHQRSAATIAEAKTTSGLTVLRPILKRLPSRVSGFNGR